MSLLYYIFVLNINNNPINKGNGQVLFVVIQFLLIFFPMLIIKKLTSNNILDFSFFSDERHIIFFEILLITILIFNYIYYFREISEKKILKKFTYKYKLIEDYPITSIFATYFSLITLCVLLHFMIMKLLI